MKPPINDSNRTSPGSSAQQGTTGAGATGSSSRPDPTGTDAGKTEVGKSEAGKPDLGRPGPTVSGAAPTGASSPTGPGKVEPVKADGPKSATQAGQAGASGPTGASSTGSGGPSGSTASPVPGATQKPGVLPAKPDTKPGASTSATADAAKMGTSKADAAKPDPAKSDPAKSGPAKPDPTKPDPSKVDAAKADGAKPDPAKPSAFGTTGRAGGDAADGPIIDLKARRVPDAGDATRRETTDKMSATGPKTAASVAGATSSASTSSASASSGATSSGTKPPSSEAGQRTASASEPKPVPVRSGGAGFGSMAAAGLIGGVIGAGLLFGVERAGILPTANGDLAGRLAALDQTVGTLASRDALASLDKRIAGNEAALKPLPDAVRNAETAAREALQKASASPTAPAAEGSPATATIPPELTARIDSLDQRLAALQEEPGRDQSVDARAALTAPGVPPEQVTKLDERLKAVEGKIDGVAKAPTGQADLNARITTLQGDVDSRTKANAEAAQALGQKLAVLQSSLDERVKAATEAVQSVTEASQKAVDANKAQAEEAAKAVARQLQAQSDRLAGLDKAVSERADAGTVQAALRVVSADRIATALSTGAPYADALASLRNFEPGDPAKLTAVAVFADKGAPTARTLATEFRAIADRMSAARKAAQAKSVAETGDISQRLMSMAGSIVQVRKVDTPASEAAQDTDPTVAVQAALDRGAIAEAAKAFAAMPEAARASAGDFGTKLASRAAAGEAAQALLSDAFKGLSAPSPR
ncbi:hypothetical protein ASG40_07790 [Methylobacterium sp. Leaf399]|uniref:hypothetical protein n=1 Tax=Methylobacterium sp. Leaf399 TaxID=1736364 RepID=UPI0006F6A8CC|nr:hypothetical protein [Methylobacterium sp. Leaf399]KQT11895.1 hypothetical protein ASG40_07790 [Methylobacterium sp. Leaf399]